MKKILIFFLSAALGVAAQAQEQDTLTVYFAVAAHAQRNDTLTVYSAHETAAELNKPEKYPLNWFVGVGGGFNMSTDLRKYSTESTGNGTGISVDIYAGKWFTRYFGARLGYHGINTSFNDVALPSRDHGSHPFFYVHADALFRPTTWLVPFVHAGYINVTHANLDAGIAKKHKHALGGGLGVMFPIRAGRFRVVPGLRATMMNGGVGTYDDTPQKETRIKISATLGLAYTIGKQKPRVIREVTEVPYEVLRIDTVHVHTHTVDTVYLQRELNDVADKINSRTQADVLFDLNSRLSHPPGGGGFPEGESRRTRYHRGACLHPGLRLGEPAALGAPRPGRVQLHQCPRDRARAPFSQGLWFQAPQGLQRDGRGPPPESPDRICILFEITQDKQFQINGMFIY